MDAAADPGRLIAHRADSHASTLGDMEPMAIGVHAADHGQPVRLRPEKFNRHTFWCGQSGSGKTYALGVVLERLLADTELPVLVLDPNADFVRLAETREAAPADRVAALPTPDVRILRPGGHGEQSLRVRYRDLSLRAKAAVLRLDPVQDPAEYNALLRATRDLNQDDVERFLADLHRSDDAGHRGLAYRIENLEVLDWELWAREKTPATAVVDRRHRATVLDLGGFRNPDEPQVAALAVLDDLWAARASRRPVLIVIDEAHNLCPAEPTTPVERALTERIVQIAAEGRKFGLWLLLSTQRPGKIHPNAVSQCDNLTVMKMSSPRDLAELAELFGYAPPELLRRAQTFRQGQALMAGGFIEEPTLVQLGERWTEEGGSDVAVPLRARS